MSLRQTTVDYILEQMAAAGAVSARKMFGEYAIYCEGKLVALVCDDQLFVKPTQAGRAILATTREGSPYPGAKPCLVIDEETLEDRIAIAALIRATAAELPTPASKTVRSRKRQAG